MIDIGFMIWKVSVITGIKNYDNYSRRLQEKIMTMKESSDTESNVSGGSRPLSGVSPGDTPRHYKVSGGS